MREVTLQVEDDHYKIFEHFAELYKKPIEEYVLEAAKCSIFGNLVAELDGDEVIGKFEFHKLLGGEDEG